MRDAISLTFRSLNIEMRREPGLPTLRLAFLDIIGNIFRRHALSQSAGR